MLTPKWLIFLVLFYGSTVALGVMLNGTWAPSCMTDLGTGLSSVEKIKEALIFDYAWMDGYLGEIVRWTFRAIGVVAVFLIFYESVSGFFGRR